MADIHLTTGFSTVPSGSQEPLKRVLIEVIEQVGQEEGSFKKAKVVFTESDERCVLTAELDGIRKEPNPLQLDLDVLEDALIESGARSILKEEIRTYFRKVLGR
jgi:hypothetical protein